MSNRDALIEAYAAALQTWLDEGGEAALSSAYDVGRAAVGEGFGLLELMTLHDAAARRLQRGGLLTLSDDERVVQFFAEAVAPFEMALRGYQESNHRLAELNAVLQRQNEELREAQREAIAANRELEAFSGRAAHDLRSPLGAVDGFAQLLLDDDATVGEVERQWVQQIRDSTRHMLRLVHELLQLSRASGAELRRERVDLGALAETIVTRLRAAHPERSPEVVIANDLHGFGDPYLLVIVLENLLANAFKFTARTPHPRIEVGAEGGADACFFVRDNGAGFDMEKASKLFTPFTRLHHQRDFEGTGIGLATVMRILQRHGGGIRAEATPGQGATFRFTLGPVADDAALQPRQ